jgi:hypothetical protein
MHFPLPTSHNLQVLSMEEVPHMYPPNSNWALEISPEWPWSTWIGSPDFVSQIYIRLSLQWLFRRMTRSVFCRHLRWSWVKLSTLNDPLVLSVLFLFISPKVLRSGPLILSRINFCEGQKRLQPPRFHVQQRYKGACRYQCPKALLCNQNFL